MASQLARCRWLVRCAPLVVLVAVALCLMVEQRGASARTDTLAETPLSREATKDAEALSGEILRSYESVPSRDRERRTVGSFGDSFYGTPLATELTVVYYSGKHSGYILQADYAENERHTISPARGPMCVSQSGYTSLRNHFGTTSGRTSIQCCLKLRIMRPLNGTSGRSTGT